MRSMRQGKHQGQERETLLPRAANRVKSEWPLLIYPVLFLSTLAILYVVNRSIERQMPAMPAQRPSVQKETASSDRLRHPDTSTPVTRDDYAGPRLGPTTDTEQSNRARRTASYLPPKRGDRRADNANRFPTATDGTDRASDLDQLQGTDKLIAILQMAVGENDHARIKECMDQLVALGDAAVVPLNDLMNVENETGLWAAEALARIGTPLAASVLLEKLAQTKEGLYKEELGKRVASISNHDSWPILLDSIIQTGDATVLRAAGGALSTMADTPIVDAIVAHYEAAGTEEMAERLAQLVCNIQSPSAAEALLSLAGDVSSAPQDSLQQAAVEALGRIGDPQCVSHLLRRLEAAVPGEGTEVFNTITQINRPEAHTSLLYAAAGSKEVSAENGQTAAILALKNYPDSQTIALLEHLIAEVDNDKVRAAATRTLDDIKQEPHMITAKAEPAVKEEPHILPPLPEKQ
jgi:HEAT repeat protein